MFDTAAGSFGVMGGGNPWAVDNGVLGSMGGMYLNGRPNSFAPPQRLMYGSAAQMYYGHGGQYSPFSDFRQSQHYTEDVDLGSYIKHAWLGKPFAIGEQPQDYYATANEKSAVFKDALFTSLGSFGASVGLGAASYSVGGLTGGILGGAGMAIGFLGQRIVDTRMDNYARTQEIGMMTDHIIGRNGAMGLSSRDVTDITKFLGSTAAKDTLVNIDDLTNIMKMGSDSGFYSNATNKRKVKDTTIKLTNMLKDLGDIMGTSDLKALFSQMDKYSQLGYTLPQTKEIVSRLKATAKMSGMTIQELTGQVDQNMARANYFGQTKSSALKFTMENSLDYGIMMQNTSSNSMFRNKSTYNAASGELSEKASVILDSSYGVSDAQKKLYIYSASKKRGVSHEKITKELESKSLSEQSKLINTIGNYAEEDKGVVRPLLGDAKSILSLVEADPDKFNSIKTERPLETLIKNQIKKLKKEGKGTSTDEVLSSILSTFGADNIAPNQQTMGLLRKRIEMEINPNMQNIRHNVKVQRESFRQAQEIGNKHERDYNNHSLWARAIVLGGTIKDKFRNTVGGFGTAENVRDFNMNLYGNGKIVGETERGIKNLRLSKDGNENLSSVKKIENMAALKDMGIAIPSEKKTKEVSISSTNKMSFTGLSKLTSMRVKRQLRDKEGIEEIAKAMDKRDGYNPREVDFVSELVKRRRAVKEDYLNVTAGEKIANSDVISMSVLEKTGYANKNNAPVVYGLIKAMVERGEKGGEEVLYNNSQASSYLEKNDIIGEVDLKAISARISEEKKLLLDKNGQLNQLGKHTKAHLEEKGKKASDFSPFQVIGDYISGKKKINETLASLSKLSEGQNETVFEQLGKINSESANELRYRMNKTRVIDIKSSSVNVPKELLELGDGSIENAKLVAKSIRRRINNTGWLNSSETIAESFGYGQGGKHHISSEQAKKINEYAENYKAYKDTLGKKGASATGDLVEKISKMSSKFASKEEKRKALERLRQGDFVGVQDFFSGAVSKGYKDGYGAIEDISTIKELFGKNRSWDEQIGGKLTKEADRKIMSISVDEARRTIGTKIEASNIVQAGFLHDNPNIKGAELDHLLKTISNKGSLTSKDKEVQKLLSNYLTEHNLDTKDGASSLGTQKDYAEQMLNTALDSNKKLDAINESVKRLGEE